MPRPFDPNAIPDRDRGGRMGELDPAEPEEAESSALAHDADGAEAGRHGGAEGDRFEPEPPPLEDRRAIDADEVAPDRRQPPVTERRRR